MLIEFQDFFSTSFGIYMNNFHVFLKFMYFKRLLDQFTDLDVLRNNFPKLSFSQSSCYCSPLTQDLVYSAFPVFYIC